MNGLLKIILALALYVWSESFEEYQNSQQALLKAQQEEFKSYEKSSKEAFVSFLKAQKAALNEWENELKQVGKSGLRTMNISKSAQGSVAMRDLNYGKTTVTVKALAAGHSKQQAVKQATLMVQNQFRQAVQDADPERVGRKKGELSKEEISRSVVVQKSDSGFVATATIEKPFSAVMPVPSGVPSRVTSSKNRKADYTSLIVDARGLNAKACLIPMVQSPSGKVVYGPKEVSKESAVNGMAVWVDNLETATTNPKAGPKPLVIKVSSLAEGRRLVVPEESAQTVVALSGSPVLRECKVIIVVD